MIKNTLKVKYTILNITVIEINKIESLNESTKIN